MVSRGLTGHLMLSSPHLQFISCIKKRQPECIKYFPSITSACRVACRHYTHESYKDDLGTSKWEVSADISICGQNGNIETLDETFA